MAVIAGTETAAAQAETSRVTVLRAHESNAASNWAINYGGHLALSPERPDPDTNKLKPDESAVMAHFSDPRKNFEGRTSTDWLLMIKDTSGEQAVFNAWIDYRQDEDGLPVGSPAGMARVIARSDETVRLDNFHIARHIPRHQWAGVFSGLYAAVSGWSEDQPLLTEIPKQNEFLLAAFAEVGFLAREMVPDHSIDGLITIKHELRHPATGTGLQNSGNVLS
jgi:hypothetical protein